METMNKEKISKLNNIQMYIFAAWALCVLALFYLIPESRQIAFDFLIVKAVGFIVLSLSALAGISVYFIKRREKIVPLAFYCLFCVVIFVMGAIDLSHYISDKKTGAKNVTLYSCQIERTRTGGQKTLGTIKYYLKGSSGSVEYRFSLKGLSSNEINELKNNDEAVHVMFYPASGILVSYEIVDWSDTTEAVGEVEYEVYEASINELLEESKLPYEMLKEVTDFEDYSVYNCLYESDEVSASYVGKYQKNDESLFVTKITFTGGGYNVFGFEIGADITEFDEVLKEHGYTFLMTCDDIIYGGIPEEVSSWRCFQKDGVTIIAFYNDRGIIEIRVLFC